MKLKRTMMIGLSCLSSMCVTLGTVAYVTSDASIYSGNSQTTVSTSLQDEAYLLGKKDSVVAYEKDNNSDVMGLKATLVGEDTLTLRNVIDLNDMYKKGQTFLEVLPVVEEIGYTDYKSVMITMVDVYDSNNYIQIKMSTNPDGENESDVAYFLACASNGQKLSGYEWNGDPNSTGTLHVSNSYGQWSAYSFSDQEGERSGTGFYYDVVNKSIYAQPLNGGVKRQIIDFDNPAFFGSYLWEGFTTNEVYCTIRCMDYKKESVSLLISKYGDYNLAKMEATDEVAPILTVDLGAYTEQTLPNGLINYPYSLFDASARDAFDGNLKTSVEVVYGYDTTTPKQINVKNGAFVPNEVGSYRIKYYVIDSHGNSAEQYIYVNAQLTQPKMEIEFNDVITQTTEGELYKIPAYAVKNALGIPTVEIKATLNGKEIEVGDEGIRPFVSGTMEITYTIKDFVGRKLVEKHEIIVEEAITPTFIEKPLLPKRLIFGNTYKFPSLNAYNYVTEQGTPVETQIFVKENGMEKELSNGRYVPGNVSEVEVIYRASIGQEFGEWKVTLPVYDVKTNGYLDMSKYFLPMNKNGNVQTSNSSVDLFVNADTSFEFINYVTTYPFITEFTYGENPTNVGKFHIYLTDIANANNYLKFTYDFTGGVAYFYLNDNQNLKSSISVKLQEKGRNQLLFNSNEKAVYFDINKGSAFPVTSFYNGNAYNGFTDDKVYVSYAFEGVKGNASMGINNLNLTYLSNDNGDYMAPLVSLLGKVGGEREINEIIELPKILANDVFAGDVDAYITVKDPMGQFVSTEDGILLNNYLCDNSSLKIKLAEYGKYEVQVSAQDDAGNLGSAAMIIRVLDTQAPTLTFSKDIPQTAKVGEKIQLPVAKVEDNLSKECTVKLYVFNSSGHVLKIGENDSGFIAKSAGIYTVVYYVLDEAGNFSSLRFTITIT